MDGAIPGSVSVALLQVHLQGLPLLTLASLPGAFLIFLSWLPVRSDSRTTPFLWCAWVLTAQAQLSAWNALLAWDFSVQAAHTGTLWAPALLSEVLFAQVQPVAPEGMPRPAPVAPFFSPT